MDTEIFYGHGNGVVYLQRSDILNGLVDIIFANLVEIDREVFPTALHTDRQTAILLTTIELRRPLNGHFH